MFQNTFRLRYAPLAGCLFLLCLAGAEAAEKDSAFLAGYVQAILEREFDFAGVKVEVTDTTIVVRVEGLKDGDTERIGAALATIPDGGRGIVVNGTPVQKQKQTLFPFPDEELFAPLMADPRWPRFSAAYLRHLDDDQLENVGAVSFGGSFPFLRYSPRPDSPKPGWHLQFGLQAAVFSVFDLDSESTDLVNSDFWVGVPVSYRWADLSVIGRVFHQSSHLGDEFLLRNRVDRVNLSYEAVDLLVSYDLGPRLDKGRNFERGRALRLYGGGGVLVRRDPSDLDRLWAQAGFELKSPDAVLGNRVRPVLAADFQSRQEYDWEIDVSARAGIQIERIAKTGRQVQFLIEYFHGRSPNGQFYEKTIEFVGFEGRLRF